MRKNIILLGLFLLPVLSFASVSKNDFEFYKDIQIKKEAPLYFFKIDDDIESHSKKYLSDLRIFNGENEIPYKIVQEKDEYKKIKKDIPLSDVKREGKYFIINLKKDDPDEYLNRVYLKTKSKEFRRSVHIYGADFVNGLYVNLDINKDKSELVYDLPEKKKLYFDFKFSNYKYIKIYFYGDEGEFQPDEFYRVEDKTEVKRAEKSEKIVLAEERDLGEKDQALIFDLKKNNLFFNQLELRFFDKRFKRRYKLYASDVKDAEILKEGQRFDKNKNYWVKISEGVLVKESYTGDPVLDLENDKRFYRLDIFNDDNSRLKFNEAVFEKYLKKVFFKTDSKKLKLYYSSSRVDEAKYDFVFDKNSQKAEVFLSAEKKNPDYLAEKKNIFDDNKWLIYLMIGIVVLILIFFVYKIIKESNNKTDKDGIQI